MNSELEKYKKRRNLKVLIRLHGVLFSQTKMLPFRAKIPLFRVKMNDCKRSERKRFERNGVRYGFEKKEVKSQGNVFDFFRVVDTCNCSDKMKHLLKKSTQKFREYVRL